jgi:amidophosphoribosyltransferase
MDDLLDRPHEECGVVGIWSHPGRKVDVARLMFFCLYALQHRGQESAGIATSDGHQLQVHRGMGLVSQVFTEQNLAPLTGHLGIGHNRYSTTGSSHLANAQPYVLQTLHGPLSVAHNGNVTNAVWMRRHLMERGVGLTSTSDTEAIAQYLAMPPAFQSLIDPGWDKRMARLMEVAEGAYSFAILTRDAVWAMRDPLGMRPLCVGHLKENGEIVAWLVASESSALLTIGAKVVRELDPGELVRIDQDGITTVHRAVSPRKPALCVFEYVYFARPDSMMNTQSVQVVRSRMGRQLAREAPAEADLVFGVPDSSVPAAMAYGEELGIPYREGLIKNRYIGRTFIQPSEALRKNSVRLKFNALRENLEGKRVVMIDDSIVRGTTMGPLVRLVREAGKAKEVHVRVASPPIRHPCFMGVDLASHDQLIAHHMSVEEICKHVGADSLAYLSVEGLHRAVEEGMPAGQGHCNACFTGRYPVDVSEMLGADAKHQFERGGGI